MWSKRLMFILLAGVIMIGAFAVAVGQQADPHRQIGSWPGYGSRIQYYAVPKGYPPYSDRVRFIGQIRGTWHEMGVQYGRKAGDLIRVASDYNWETQVARFGPEHLKEDLARYAKAVDDFSPKMTEFFKGMAEGAKEEFTQSKFKGQIDDYERIIINNYFHALSWNHPPDATHTGKTTPMPPAKKTTMPPAEDEGPSCTGAALSGQSKLTATGVLLSPTRSGETLITQNMDIGSFAPWGWNVAYVASPNDGNTFWTMGTAGMVGANNMIVDEKGLALGHYAGGWRNRPADWNDTTDFGIQNEILFVYTAAYANNAKEAVQWLMQGPPEYRERTGNKIVINTGGWGSMVADPDEVAMVEITSHRVAVRYPGELQERGNYVVFGNWNGSKYYYGKDFVKREVPQPIKTMTGLDRHYAYEWFIRHHFGEIDIDMAKQMQQMTWNYDVETGVRNDFTADGTPVYLKGSTPCRFIGLDNGGSMWGTQAILRKNGRSQIWYTQGRPCEWVGPWHYVDFAGYLK